MSLRDRRSRQRQFTVPKLMLTSMMDMFTIILIFLLFCFSEEPDKLQLDKDLDLAYPSVKQDYNNSIRLVISQDNLILDGEIIATLSQGKKDGLDPYQLKNSIFVSETYRTETTVGKISKSTGCF